jgi:Ni/Co efflux regulator RcnB
VKKTLIAVLLGALLAVAAPTAALADDDDRDGRRHRSEHRFRHDDDDHDGRFFRDFRRHRRFIFIDRPHYSKCGWGYGRFGGWGPRHCGYFHHYPVYGHWRSPYSRCGLGFYGHYRYIRSCGYGHGPWF